MHRLIVAALACAVAAVAQIPRPGGGGGGVGTAAPPYTKTFSAVTTITATAAQHGAGTTAIPGDCWDNATPNAKVALTAGYPQRAANGDITWAWSGSKTGSCYVWSASASGSAGGDLAGTYPNPTITQAGVTQHQAALSIATSQLTGTLPDARVAESNVTQHEAALTIAQSQVTNLTTDLAAKYGSGANPLFGNISGSSMTITAGGAGTPVVGRTHASTVAADPFFGIQNSSNTWLGGFLGSGKVNVPAITSGAAVWDSSGTLQKASGTASDCVKVDGSSGPCGTGGGASAAEDVTFTPAGGLSATDVQAALEELDSEKEAGLGNPLSDGLCLVSTAAGVRSWAACGTGAASVYAASKTSATTWDVTGATHTLATADLHVMLYSSSGGVRTQVLAQSVVIDEDDYDVHITFASAQAGRIVIIAGGGTGGEGGGLSDAYSSITDGSTTASASGGDTFKLRSASNLLTVAVQSNDVTHGDNALLTVNQANFALSSIGGAVTDSQVPNNITIDLAAAATALAANGSNCSAGSAPIGVDASGAAEGCFAVQASDADLTALAAISGSQGMIAFYGAAGWTSLSPGTSGHFLQTQGAGANPQWAAASVVAPLALTGSTDAVQLDVKGNATQTNPVFRVKKSDDTVLFQVNNDGSVEWGTGGSVMTLNEVAAPGAGASANQHNVYIDSADSKLKSHENGGSVVVYASEGYVTSALSGYAAPSEAYDATGWNGDTAPPQKDAVRDQIETMATDISNRLIKVVTGTRALDTDAIASTDCDTMTVTATGALTTDTLNMQLTGDPTAVTGYAPVTTGGLWVSWWISASDTITIKACNPTSSSITPGAIMMRYTVTR